MLLQFRLKKEFCSYSSAINIVSFRNIFDLQYHITSLFLIKLDQLLLTEVEFFPHSCVFCNPPLSKHSFWAPGINYDWSLERKKIAKSALSACAAKMFGS